MEVIHVHGTAVERHLLEPTHQTGIPPPGTEARPQLHLVIEKDVLAASQSRHPSSCVAIRACRNCGFTPPPRDDTARALRRLPSTWRAAMSARPEALARAAYLRDEIHAVTNRVARLLVAPQARLQRVRINVPTAIASASSGPVVLHRLRLSVERLARLVESMRTDDWKVNGYVEDRDITVAELVLVPLHHSHRDLLGDAGRVGRTLVIPLGSRRVTTDPIPVFDGAS
jgi:hypothetical protein